MALRMEVKEFIGQVFQIAHANHLLVALLEHYFVLVAMAFDQVNAGDRSVARILPQYLKMLFESVCGVFNRSVEVDFGKTSLVPKEWH